MHRGQFVFAHPHGVIGRQLCSNIGKPFMQLFANAFNNAARQRLPIGLFGKSFQHLLLHWVHRCFWGSCRVCHGAVTVPQGCVMLTP